MNRPTALKELTFEGEGNLEQYDIYIRSVDGNWADITFKFDHTDDKAAYYRADKMSALGNKMTLKFDEETGNATTPKNGYPFYSPSNVAANEIYWIWQKDEAIAYLCSENNDDSGSFIKIESDKDGQQDIYARFGRNNNQNNTPKIRKVSDEDAAELRARIDFPVGSITES